jgi:hypothetical protein
MTDAPPPAGAYHGPISSERKLPMIEHARPARAGAPRFSYRLPSLPPLSPDAEPRLRLVLAGFAGSVVLTRTFLEWTGYPQIAGGDFHIAHVLWGGVLLFAAALLLLIWRGPGVSRLGSLLAGAGFGLFIDEVGKFITQGNDYFYPLAAPIIYAFFLLTAFLYVRVRAARRAAAPPSTRRVLDLLEHALHPHVTPPERDNLAAELRAAAQAPDPQVAALAAYALAYLDGARPEAPTPSGRFSRLQAAFSQALTPLWLRRALLAGFALLALRGIASALAAFFFIVSIADPVRWQAMRATTTPLSSGGPFSAPHLVVVSITLLLEAISGGLFLAAVIALLARSTERGLALGYVALLLSLTAVRLLGFYFHQFDVVLTTLLQFGLLAALVHFRRLRANAGPL